MSKKITKKFLKNILKVKKFLAIFTSNDLPKSIKFNYQIYTKMIPKTRLPNSNLKYSKANDLSELNDFPAWAKFKAGNFQIAKKNMQNVVVDFSFDDCNQSLSKTIKQHNWLYLTILIALYALLIFNLIPNDVAANILSISAPQSNMPKPITNMPIKIIPSNQPVEWRDFRAVSAHPDGENIFFVECVNQPSSDCKVLRFNLKTKVLAYYDLPSEYFYVEAYLSPNGKKLSLVLIPKKITTFPETVQSIEIAIMNADGTNFEILPLASGIKTRPMFNFKNDKLAFWRAKPREQPAKTMASHYDVYEYDLKAKKEYLFAASYQFFQAGEIYYLPNGNEIVIGADVPSSDKALFGLDIWGYSKKYDNNMIFRLRRGQADWAEPLFIGDGFEFAHRVTLTHDNKIIFEATNREQEQKGSSKWSYSVYRQEQNSFSKWSRGDKENPICKIFDTGSLKYSALLGNRLIGIYHKNASGRYSISYRFLILDMTTGEWSALNIPPLYTARAIPVTVK